MIRQVFISLLFTIFVTVDARFLSNMETASETILFNLNDNSQQRSEAVGRFLENNHDVNTDLSMMLSILSSSSSSSVSSSGTSMNSDQLMQEIRRLIQEKMRKQMIQANVNNLRLPSK